MQSNLNVPAHVAIDAVVKAESIAASNRDRYIEFAGLVISIAQVELESGVPTGEAYEALATLVEAFIDEKRHPGSYEECIVSDALHVRQEFRTSGEFAPDDLDRADFDLEDPEDDDN